MKTREEIEQLANNAPIDGNENRTKALLEVLLDIRDLLAHPMRDMTDSGLVFTQERNLLADITPELLQELKSGGAVITESRLEKDPLFPEAVDVVRKHKKGSTSLLQRELKVGYVQSARLIDQLEAAGVISAPDPITNRRKIL